MNFEECDKCEAAGLPVEECPYKGQCGTIDGIALQIERAVVAERERCASVCDEMQLHPGYICAEAIRGLAEGNGVVERKVVNNDTIEAEYRGEKGKVYGSHRP